VALRFSEPVEILNRSDVSVVNERGRQVDTGAAHTVKGNPEEVIIPLRGPLLPFSYTVRYRVVSSDSHAVSAAFVFGVGKAKLGDPILAGSGGLPAGREMGRWIDTNLPQGARLMAIGPSTANIVRFYGHRPALGLSVSPNPLSRNPSYEPIDNPDRELRRGTIQYAVWDAFTASRSPFFADRLLRYVDKYNGIAVHTETITIRLADGAEVEKPVMIVYEVQP
jgi:hypothetical protein